MKITDIFESVNNSTKFIIDKTKKIKQYLTDFDILVNANGYENTENIINNYLDSMTRFAEQLLNYYATTDANFNYQYKIYKDLENQLRDRIKSGLSYE